MPAAWTTPSSRSGSPAAASDASMRRGSVRSSGIVVMDALRGGDATAPGLMSWVAACASDASVLVRVSSRSGSGR